MNAKFLEGLAGKLSERLVAAVLSPAFTFLGIGLLAWLWSRGWTAGWATLAAWVGKRTAGESLVLIVGVLIGVVVLGSLAEALTVPVIRMLEGYWPRWLAFAGWPLRRWHIGRFRRREQRFQAAALAARPAEAAATLRWAATRAEDALYRYPPDESLLLPTRLGNTLRASEMRPYYKYGLDPVRCWNHLWLVLPDSARAAITEARSRLDAAAVAVTFSVAVAIWTIWAWWALPLALVAAAVAYRVYAIAAAEAYGDLVEAACDVYRPALYSALRFQLPQTPDDDHELAGFVNRYLQTGARSKDRIFMRPAN
ncbi:hypothetical protein [Micromonospora saelicesensis]|uniref:Uncharacterized protein n=1 Tax=Micromonospora saelicesensis TaxID=285676 RepID=A0A1C4Z336_9ACTN|nr:hypothetical protein [Micromonospora saelicesensis]RAO42617.1 hypothetical protein GAR06_05143 [Micromonospora saelicesensis]RAO42833.1 hypothetical protein PSN01_06085 [Micromonospora saelicesensis]SCF27385.1 hypothetical protein GA0070561_4868 [Micromonospora saelicesensis]